MPDCSLFIGRPVGWQLEAGVMGTWLAGLGFSIGRKFPEITCLASVHYSNTRVGMSRNKLVGLAREDGATHLLMIDPDLHPDFWCGRTGKWFFPEAWQFLEEHPGAICAAPYCGRSPMKEIHVFGLGTENQMVRLARADLQGWVRVAGVGTGLFLCEMSVFQELEAAGQAPPFFEDTYTDARQEQLKFTQDVNFSIKCGNARVPIYVNFDTPAAHQQFVTEQLPGWEQGPPHGRMALPQLRLTPRGEPIVSYQEPSHVAADPEHAGLCHANGDDRPGRDDLGHRADQRLRPRVDQVPLRVHRGDGDVPGGGEPVGDFCDYP